MQIQLKSISDVSRLLNIRKYRIEYALSEGKLPEPKLRFLGKRCFLPEDIAAVATFFHKTHDGQAEEGVSGCMPSNS